MLALLAVAVTALALPMTMYAGNKKKGEDAKPKPTILDKLDYSKIVWPNPPAITRVKYLNLFYGEKYQPQGAGKKKGAWMDRLAGVATGENPSTSKLRFQLLAPYGVAVDSKGRLYVADAKVGAIFIFDTENPDSNVDLIKNGLHARFGLITGLALDDADHLFVSDSQMNRVLVFDSQHRVEGSISAGMADPAGLAIDNQNRFLYVADTGLDQVLVYDADPPYKLLRKMGTGGKKHTLTSPGDFAKPTNLAVDSDGNLYVSDTFNDRVEIFDADGNFVRTFGKPGDGPGYFTRPKGIAIDRDGHVWVADAVQDRVQVFTPEGQVLLWMGGHGVLPGQFSSLAGLTIDKNNRVFTSEQYPGRVQMFRYFTDEEARVEKARRDAEEHKKSAGGKTAGQTATPSATGAPAQKDAAAAKPPGSAAR